MTVIMTGSYYSEGHQHLVKVLRVGEQEFELAGHAAGPRPAPYRRPVTVWELLILSSVVSFQPA